MRLKSIFFKYVPQALTSVLHMRCLFWQKRRAAVPLVQHYGITSKPRIEWSLDIRGIDPNYMYTIQIPLTDWFTHSWLNHTNLLMDLDEIGTYVPFGSSVLAKKRGGGDTLKPFLGLFVTHVLEVCHVLIYIIYISQHFENQSPTNFEIVQLMLCWNYQINVIALVSKTNCHGAGRGSPHGTNAV